MGNDIKTSDQVLIRHIIAGSEMAFNTIFSKYYEYAFGVAMLYCDVMDAEEVVSDVFAKIWDKRNKLENIDNFKSYLFISLKNQSLNYLRKKKVDVIPIENAIVSTMMKDFDPQQQTESNELNKVVDSVISNLPPKCYAAYKLVFENGLKYKDAAVELGVSENTLDAHLKKATKRILDVIKSYGLHFIALLFNV